MSEPVLVIMAAGMGSRYGGLKQIDPVGACGEKIIDFSLFDARRAGFQKAVFIIKEELLPDFQEAVFQKASQYMEIEWVFQKLTDVPEGVVVPEGRVKPWGTGHAALTAARVLGDAPYAVINADDFYGREAFEKIYKFLKNAQDGEKLDFAMVGFYLKNTVTENGYVSRGVCETAGGMLRGITERTRIEKKKAGIAYSEDEGQDLGPPVSGRGSLHESVGLYPRFYLCIGGGFPRASSKRMCRKIRKKRSSSCPLWSMTCWLRERPR